MSEYQDFDCFGMDDGTEWMRQLVGLRADLLLGDHRPLYLGWLAGMQFTGQEDPEPKIPPDLDTLSPSQEALVAFLEIEGDLLTAATLRRAREAKLRP